MYQIFGGAFRFGVPSILVRVVELSKPHPY